MTTHHPIIIERTFAVPAHIIWKALTDDKEMKKWYFDLPGFKAETGYQFTFEGGKDPEHPYIHLCEITEVIELQKLTYSWRYKGYEGISYVTFELFETPDKSATLLKLTHSGIHTFPTSNPDLAPENFVAGWTDIINTSLQQYITQITN